MPTFVPNKIFGQLLSISPTNHIYTEIFRLEFSYIELWFSDQNYKPLKTEDRVNLTLVVNDRGIKPDIPVSPVICVKGYGFLSFVENVGKRLSQNLRSKYEKKLLDTATNGFQTQSGLSKKLQKQLLICLKMRLQKKIAKATSTSDNPKIFCTT